MSHFTRLKTQIKDKERLIRCLEQMEIGEILENAKIRGYASNSDVEIAIRMKEGYDIGLAKNSEGSYDIVADWWGVKGVSQQVFMQQVKNLENEILRDYAVQTVTEQVTQMGFNIAERQEEKDGSVRIVVRRWS